MLYFRILVVSGKLCRSNQSYAFFGVCSFGCAHFFISGGKIMFENVGQKIKNVAKTVFVVGIIVSIIESFSLIPLRFRYSLTKKLCVRGNFSQ